MDCWQASNAAIGARAASAHRLWLPVERGVLLGNPLGPLVHTAALNLEFLRLSTAHQAAVVCGFHDDVIVAADPVDMAAILDKAASAGAEIDAELPLVKCAGWSPSGARHPDNWPAKWVVSGVTQFSVPLETAACMARAVDALAATQAWLCAASTALTPDLAQ